MAELIPCPKCQATLRVPDGAAGKAIRCPRCHEVVPIPPPEPPPEPALMTAELLPLPEAVDESTAAPALADEPPPERPKAREPGRRRKGRPKPKRRRWLPAITVEGPARTLGCVLLVCAGLAVVGVVAAYFGMRAFEPPTIPPAQWEAVEVPGRFRAKLPGEFRRLDITLLGPRLDVHFCEPNPESVYLVGCAREPKTPDRPLEDYCTAVVQTLAARGWKEVRREPVAVGPRQGLQLIVRVSQPSARATAKRIPGGYLSVGSQRYLDEPQAAWPAGGDGTMIARFVVAHDRLFLALAGGRHFDARQKNVTRLFESFEVLGPPPEPEG